MSDYTADLKEMGNPTLQIITKDWHRVVQYDLPKTWEVRVYAKDKTRVRSDTAMDRASSTGWAWGAVDQYGGRRAV